MLRRTGAWAYDRDVMARNKPATSVRSCSTSAPPPAGIKVPRPTAPQAPQVPPVYRPSMGPAAQPKIAGGAPVATPIKILPARTPPQLPPLDGPGAPRRPLVTPPQIPLGAVQQKAAAGTRTGVGTPPVYRKAQAAAVQAKPPGGALQPKAPARPQPSSLLPARANGPQQWTPQTSGTVQRKGGRL